MTDNEVIKALDWLVTSDTHQRMEIVHRNTGTVKAIHKDGGLL